ncbi:MAG: prepilin-type N-terminal cleavage/methylation domain-containing protein [Clostridia bacterium]|nr:prepilin-type N-terminal cleavage/methylation domain-containing protein [Clostridia bacterium]
MRNKKGVTLVALVVTIIIVLILAAVTISLTIGQDGIITKAQQAGIETKIAEIKDKMKLDILNAETDAAIRGESLEKAQLDDIIARYGELQEDGDTIVMHEGGYKISLEEIWHGNLANSGSYTEQAEEIAKLKKELEELKLQNENLQKVDKIIIPSVYGYYNVNDGTNSSVQSPLSLKVYSKNYEKLTFTMNVLANLVILDVYGYDAEGNRTTVYNESYIREYQTFNKEYSVDISGYEYIELIATAFCNDRARHISFTDIVIE